MEKKIPVPALKEPADEERRQIFKMGVVVQHSESKCNGVQRMLGAPEERTGGCIDEDVGQGTDVNVGTATSGALLI